MAADRILRYAELEGPENVVAGTDCGFDQAEMIERVLASVVWAKLQSRAEGAALASKEFF